MQSAAGGTSQRLNPAPAMMRSRSRMPGVATGTGMARSNVVILFPSGDLLWWARSKLSADGSNQPPDSIDRIGFKFPVIKHYYRIAASPTSARVLENLTDRAGLGIPRTICL